MEIRINIGGIKLVLGIFFAIIALTGFLVYEKIIDGKDFIIVIATLVAPMLAVQAQVIRENMQKKVSEEYYKKQELESRQRLVFRQMMAYRANPADPMFVQALNIVPVDFKGVGAVEEAWKKYFKQLCVRQNEQINWIELCNDRRSELLASMAKHLGYEFSLEELKDEKYMSEGVYNEMIMRSEIIKAVHDVLTKNHPIPVRSFVSNMPAGEGEGNLNDKL